MVKIIRITSVLVIFYTVWAQVIDSTTGEVRPMILWKADKTFSGLNCFDEDPDTGDRVYGGEDLEGAFLGFKDGSDTATMNDPTIWKWKHIDFTHVHKIFYCKFTPETVASTGNNKVIATLDDKLAPPGYLAASLWLPKKVATSAQLALLPVKLHEMNLLVPFEVYTFSSYLYQIDTDLHWWISNFETSGVRNLMRLVFNMAVEQFTISTVHKFVLISPMNPAANQYLQLLLKPDKTKLYVAVAQPLGGSSVGTVANCIMRVAMPMQPSDLVSGGENQQCNVHTGPTCSGETNKDCIVRSLGPMAYFDKLVTLQYWRVARSNLPYTYPQVDINFIGECSPGVFHKINFADNKLSHMMISEAKALNSTSNYFVIKSSYYITTAFFNYQVLHVHFDPDTTNCAGFVQNTPVRAEFRSPKYMHNEGTDGMLWNAYFSSYSAKLKGFVYAGTQNTFQTAATWSTSVYIGFANAILLSEIDWYDYSLTPATPALAFDHTAVVQTFNSPTIQSLPTVASTLTKDVVFSQQDETMIGPCFQTIRQNLNSKYKPGTTHTMYLGLGGPTETSVIPLTELFILPTDPACLAGIGGQSYDSIFKGASAVSFTANATHFFTPATTANTAQSTFSFKLFTSNQFVYSQMFNLTFEIHECAVALAFTNKAITITNNITKYSIDGTATPAGPEEYVNITSNLFTDGSITYTANPSNCFLMLTFDSIKNSSDGTNYPADTGLNNYYLNYSSGDITIFNYYSTGLSPEFAASSLYINVQNSKLYTPSVNGAIIFSTAAHICNQAVNIVFNTTAPLNTLNLDFSMEYVDFDTPPKMNLVGTGPKTMTVDIRNYISSNDPLCPITQIEIAKVTASNGTTFYSAPSWLKWDNVTQMLTWSDFIDVQPPNINYLTFMNVTTSYSWLQPTQNVGMVQFLPDTCSVMAFVQNTTQSGYIITNEWESETGQMIVNKSQTVPVITFDIKTMPPLSSTNETMCPTVAYRITNAYLNNGTVYPLELWNDKITVSMTELVIKIEKYGSINVTDWSYLDFDLQSLTKNAISQNLRALTLQAVHFRCTADRILSWTPESVQPIIANYTSYQPLQGDKQVNTNVTDLIVDMSSGFFDRGTEKNCSLSKFKLTNVFFANDTVVSDELWISLFLFDSSKNELKITQYAGLNTTDFNQTRLMFQALIADDSSAMTKAWHLINFTVQETIIKEEPKPVIVKEKPKNDGPQPPEFISPLQPIYITEDFSELGQVKFQTVKYQLPLIVDPAGLKVKPVTLINLAKFKKFTTWDQETKTLTVDPNLIPKNKWECMIKLKVRLENDEAKAQFDLAIVITNLAKPSESDLEEFKNCEEELKEDQEKEPKPNDEAQSEGNNKQEQSPTEDSATKDNTAEDSNSKDSTDSSTEDAAKDGTKEDKASTATTTDSGTGFIPNFFGKGNKEEKPNGEIKVEEEEWVRPPEPPQLRAVSLGSKGEMKLKFSQAIAFPDYFFKMLEEDQQYLAAMKEGQKVDGSQRRMLVGGRGGGKGGGIAGGIADGDQFISLQLEGAISNERTSVSRSNIYITDITDTQMAIKVIYENPEMISMSDQAIQDRLVISFGDLQLVGQNGLPFNDKNLDKDEEGNPIQINDIQPMVDENAEEVQALEATQDTIFNIGFIMMGIQFLATLVLSIGLAFFFELIGSQINFIYLPLMRVNAPGQVSFYLDVLIFVCTFDPIPMDIIYEIFPMMTFDVVSNPNERSVFSRIGIEDRNIIIVLGSMILFIAFFVLTQAVYLTISPFRQYSKWVRRIIPYFTPSAAYRTIIMIFLLEAYLDLTLGGLVSTENDYLLEDPDNWGPRGNLTKSDQFSIVLGNIFYISTMVFPFVVMFVIELKHKNRYSVESKNAQIDGFYESMYEGFKVNITGFFHYQSLSLMRRLAYAFIVFYLYEEEYTLFQVMANLLLSFLFAFYIAHFKPFIESETNYIQFLNEVTFYVVSVIYLMFTDFNPDPEIKIQAGWVVVLVAILNLIYPNLTTMLQGVLPELKEALFGSKSKINLKNRKRSLKQFEAFRKKFIEKQKLKLKKEFQQEEEELKIHPKSNQVIDITYFKETSGVEDFYKIKKEKLKEQMKLKHYVPVDDIFEVDQAPPLGVISEHSEKAEQSSKDWSFSGEFDKEMMRYK